MITPPHPHSHPTSGDSTLQSLPAIYISMWLPFTVDELDAPIEPV